MASEVEVTQVDIEKEVSEALAADPNYPLGEPDAMKWAVAWRLIRDRKGIDANASQAGGDIDGWMVGWFANAMASARPEMLMQRALSAPQPSASAKDAVEQAARYVLRNSRRGNASLSDEQFAADTDKLMEAYRDIIGKAIRSGFVTLPVAQVDERARARLDREGQ